MGLRDWKIDHTGSTTVLNLYFWDANGPDLDFPIESYEVEALSADKLTLKRLDDSGSLEGDETDYARIRNAVEEANMDFSLSGKDREEQCAHILSGEVTDYPVPLPITCESPILPGGDSLQFAFDAYGSLTVRDGQTIVCRIGSDNTDVLDSNAGPFLASDVFALQDVTYDGYKDIAIRSSAGAYNSTVDYYAYDPVKKAFDCSAPFFEAENPEINAKDRTITSEDLINATGAGYDQKAYQFEHGSYVEIAEETQYPISGTGANQPGYRHVVRELKDGAWATTTDELLPGTDF
jgi:hypothetical protein